ncbi:MAG: hypothetical protein ABW065_02310 [Solirubrobacterales bacterium]
MRTTRLALLPLALVGISLALASYASAAKAPSLASTAQYKAFVEYVKKLDGLVGQPTSSAQKDLYEKELSAKKEAAAHKANALFNRSSDEAEADSDAKFKEQVAVIHRGEAAEIEALEAETDARRVRAEASYHAKLAKINAGRHKFEARAHEQIEALRARKAQATDPSEKDAIQEQIARLISEVSSKRDEESEKRADLKAGFIAQKQTIQAGEDKRADEIEAAAEAKIAKSAKHWKGVFGAAKATLNAKRESQLAYLLAKLEKGRADIATMPAAG